VTSSEHDLPDAWTAALLLAFGVVTSLLIGWLAELGARPFDLLLLAGSLGALITAGLWLWMLAARRSLGWGLLFAATCWVPYLNFVVASIYARRYWSEGARAPALLALLAMVVETVATFRVFLPDLTPPV
jgi:hypothetical protein